MPTSKRLPGLGFHGDSGNDEHGEHVVAKRRTCRRSSAAGASISCTMEPRFLPEHWGGGSAGAAGGYGPARWGRNGKSRRRKETGVPRQDNPRRGPEKEGMVPTVAREDASAATLIDGLASLPAWQTPG